MRSTNNEFFLLPDDLKPLEARYSNARDFHDYVKSTLEIEQFYIAGGSVGDLVMGKKRNDIDIYFESQEDYDLALSVIQKKTQDKNPSFFHRFSTSSAETFYTDINGIGVFQFIKKVFGSPQDIVDSFDLNKSKCIITNTVEFFDKSFDGELKIDFKNINADTPRRLFKYEAKGYALENDETNKLFDFLIHNSDMVFIDYYDQTKIKKNAKDLLCTLINEILVINDGRIENFKIKIEEMMDKVGEEMVSYLTDRYIPIHRYSSNDFAILCGVKNFGWDPTMVSYRSEIMSKYPEYFI